MIRKTGRRIALAALLTAMFSTNATAQWKATAIGVAEYDTEQTLLLLAGLSTGPGGMGWHPRLGVQAYHLGYDGGTARTTVFSVRPYVGLQNTFEGGSVGANLGYAFVNKDVSSAVSPAFIPDRGEGVVLSGGWDQWGTGGPMGYQLLGSYNFGSEALWARGRATTRISQKPNGQTRLGGEVAYLTGSNWYGVQPGAILEFHNGGNILGVGAGMKFFKGGGDAVYFKVEGVLPLGR
jgi:hypothetical protein